MWINHAPRLSLPRLALSLGEEQPWSRNHLSHKLLHQGRVNELFFVDQAKERRSLALAIFNHPRANRPLKFFSMYVYNVLKSSDFNSSRWNY